MIEWGMLMKMKMSAGAGAWALLACLAIVPRAHAAADPTVTGPIPGEAYLGGPRPRVPLSARGYTEEEYFVSGTATSYTSDGPMPEDGRLTVKAGDTAAYTTRIVVRRPSDMKKFNGTVLVEWLNVSAGTDGTPDFSFLNRQIVRDGYAWVGVSVQKVGLDGLPGAPAIAKPVKAADPVRYERLTHPGDAFSFDIFSQAGRVVRGASHAPAGLRALRPKHVLGIGESQSAFFLVTYVNAIDPVARVYDGFLVHARGGFGAPLTGMRLDRADPALFKSAVHFRTDARVPVLDVQSETDVMTLGSLIARQPDAEHFRLWEVPGASHADTYLINASAEDSEGVDPAVLAAALKPSTQMFGQTLSAPMNSGPQQHYVMNSALDHLNRWVRDGQAPPAAQRMEVAAESHAFALDDSGNVRGGIRSPWVEVPTAALSGLGQAGAGFAPLFGTTKAFDAAKLAQLYPGGRAQYLQKFAAATDSAIGSGFILEADKQEINALAAAMYPGAP
jgi:hypothetical protein